MRILGERVLNTPSIILRIGIRASEKSDKGVGESLKSEGLAFLNSSACSPKTPALPGS